MPVKTIPFGKLQPGDILLYHGEDIISQAIRLFDGTDVNHAGLFLGDNEIGEALIQGIIRQKKDESFRGNSWVKASRLKDDHLDMSPVIVKANQYLAQHERYAFEQLFLLAMLSITRKVKITPVFDKLVRSILDSAADKIIGITNDEKEPMICSEFVFRCYDEALPKVDDPYSLGIGATITQFNLKTFYKVNPYTFGQGIHPDSILASLVHENTESFFRKKPSFETTDTYPSAGSLEENIKIYLEEVDQPGKSFDISPDFNSIRQSLIAFGEKLPAARIEDDPIKSGSSFRGIKSRATRNLLKISSNFVTPGDLQKNQNFLQLGQVI
jgi:hypothetical protein